MDEHARTRRGLLAALGGLLLAAGTGGALAQGVRRPAPPPADPDAFDPREIVTSGHRFFGTTTRGLAAAVEESFRRYGQPNGYVLGQEAGGAIIGGVRYGEGTLYTRRAGQRPVFWQGPSIGFDAGANGDRTMMLVYGLPSLDALYQRFAGVDGSAYLIGGVGVTALSSGEITVVPIRTGVGARLGVNLGYLKFTQRPTWNPF